MKTNSDFLIVDAEDKQKDLWHANTMVILSEMMVAFAKTYGNRPPPGFSAIATVLVNVTTDGRARIVSIRRLGADVVGP